MPQSVPSTATALLAASAVLVFVLAGTSTAATSTGPNVVLFMPDDLHFFWDEAPAHPTTEAYHDNALLPNMQDIRDNGAVFTNSFVAGPKCAPSRFNLMTSRYCSGGVFPTANIKKYSGTNSNAGDGTATRVSVSVPSCKLSGDDLAHNLPTTLANAGYDTIQSGKWHLSDSLTWANSDYADHVDAVKQAGFTKPASVYIENLKTTTYDTYGFTHNMEWMVNTSLSAIDESDAAGKPFFLYFAPTLPHSGAGTIEKNLNYPDTATPNGILDASPYTTMRSRADLVAAAHVATDTRTDTYIGAMACDDALGALTQHLDETGLLDNTIIIVTMDHGQLAKDTLYEGGIRTALMVSYPASIQQGLAISTYVTNLDIGPSIIDAVGATYPGTDTSGVDGGSWWPLATGDPNAGDTAVSMRECIYTEINLERAVTCGDMKYMSWWTSADVTNSHHAAYPSASEEHQLYNLATDPTEQVNLASLERYADTLAAMQQKLYDFLGVSTATTTSQTTTEVGACQDTNKEAFCSRATKKRCNNKEKFINGCAATCDEYNGNCATRRVRKDASNAKPQARTVLIRGRPVAV